jgi:hypothetical protein
MVLMIYAFDRYPPEVIVQVFTQPYLEANGRYAISLGQDLNFNYLNCIVEAVSGRGSTWVIWSSGGGCEEAHRIRHD